MTALRVALWGVLPYVALTSFVTGHLWRYRFDQFGWTARSSQLHERRLLRWGSPLFHYGLLATAGGHVVGLLVPAALTRAVGLPDRAYHVLAVTLGVIAGASVVSGLVLLLYRRLTVRAVGRSGVASDRLMYPLLGATIALGMWNTVVGNGHDYRTTVAPWFRSIFALHPDVDAMAAAPLSFQLHALVAWALIGCWPFTRLVHAFSLPLGYLARPYIVYRSRDHRTHPRPR